MESALYGIYALVFFCIRNLTRSISERQQLLRKYCTCVLSMKYFMHECRKYASHHKN